ncbi:paired immunoglobulin-like type 2 receptor beta [Dromiciops gliroides]|uniref:paired immunoglobulin-like type 2 receptor beta n=1 Tax=Dromiciops gliroides TaxID=33562 RepID=UPI001CC4AB7D|nr:paired immunoglobulin-like type 2 receptor beta [Dromiciops gliroides]
MQCLLALLLGVLSWTGMPIGPKASCEVIQPSELSAPLHGSVTIPFTFSFPWELNQKPNIRICWMQAHLYGKVIYNSSSQPHPFFWGRVFLNWKPEEQKGSLLIQDLMKEDEFLYYCIVSASTKYYGVKSISSFQGTQVKVTDEGATHHNDRAPLGPASEFFSNSLKNLIVILCFCLIHKIGVCVIIEMLVLPKVLDQPPGIPVQDRSALAS